MLKNFIFAVVNGFIFSSLITQCSIDGIKNPSKISQIELEKLVCQGDIEQPIQEQVKSMCPESMVEVKGEYCTAVAHVCKVWISEKRDRCAEYYPHSKCLGKLIPMRFCIDKYEAGNKEGEYVPRDISYIQAKDLCEARGARLPTSEEWTLACEGPERTPYDYGYKRDATKCNIDKNYIEPDNNLWYKDRQAELNRLDQSVPSGTREGCVSAYGVHDLTGNLDEFTFDSSGFLDGGHDKEAHYKSALKGGYWAPIRARCRPKTVSHNEYHHWYNSSYRCAKDIK
jgi:formylglycine-generating enzyme